VLVAGGNNTGTYLSSAELYDSATGTWSTTGSMATARYLHTATLLPNGKVLVAGGYGGGCSNSAELYDPAAGTWSSTGNLATARESHTATLLPNGKILVAGGDNCAMVSPYLKSAELYDPGTGTWSSTGNLNTERRQQTATLLPNGKVLISGGFNNSYLGAEQYDPALGTWVIVNTGVLTRIFHTATLLPNGKVLVAAGYGNGGYETSVQLYDPATASWSSTTSLNNALRQQTATLLPNGKVLLAAGRDFSGPLSTAQLFDPTNFTWSDTASLTTARYAHTATLLPNGKVLLVGGYNGSSSLSSAELYDPGLGFNSSWQPLLTTAGIGTGNAIMVSGSRFKGISEASGGNSHQNSSSNYPLVQLLSLVNEQMLFLPLNMIAGWSDTAFTSTPITVMTTNSSGYPIGYALVTVFTNGIPSDSKYVVVSPLTLNSVVSRKTHVGLMPPGDLPLNFGTPAAIECRIGGIPSGNHTLVFTFASTLNASNPVGSIAATATTSSGTQNVTASGNIGTNTQYIVNLTGVPNAAHLNVTLNGVTDSAGNIGNFGPIRMDVLLGDVSASGRTDAGDVTQVRTRTVTIPDTTTPASFRYDVNTSGRIDAGDVTATRNATVTVLP
jgi:hypothetical protein